MEIQTKRVRSKYVEAEFVYVVNVAKIFLNKNVVQRETLAIKCEDLG